MPELPAPFTVKFGENIELIDLPVIEGYTLSDWEIEEDKAEDLAPNMLMTRRAVPAPNHNIVIYTVVTKNEVEPEPEPQPTPEKKEETTTTTVVEVKEVPVIIAAAPVQVTPVQPQAPTGARVAITGDKNNAAKRYTIIIGCIALITVLLYVDWLRKKDNK